MRFLRSLLPSAIILTLAAHSSVAFDRQNCFFFELVSALGFLDEEKIFLPYEKAKSVLFVSDGLVTDPESFPLGPRVAKKYPGKRIVSTDIKVREKDAWGNFELMPMDNAKPFSFADDEFDMIVLRQGLCMCLGPSCCAGIKPGTPESRKFITEVVRVLNKKNPEAKAILHGSYGVTREMQKKWQDLCSELEREFPSVRIDFVVNDYDFFAGIRIYPRPRN